MDIARLVEAARGGSVRMVFLADHLVLHALSVANKLSSVVVSPGVQALLAGAQHTNDAMSSKCVVVLLVLLVLHMLMC